MSDHDQSAPEYGGAERRRAREEVLSRAELEQMAERVAERCISRTFELFGIDAKDMPARERLRTNLAFIDELRVGVGTVKKSVWAAIGTGIAGLVWLGFKKSGGG